MACGLNFGNLPFDHYALSEGSPYMELKPFFVVLAEPRGTKRSDTSWLHGPLVIIEITIKHGYGRYIKLNYFSLHWHETASICTICWINPISGHKRR